MESYSFGSFRIDVPKRALLRDGVPVPLTPKVFDTLLVLVRNRDRVVEKRELMDAIWPGSFVEDANLTQNISVLRKALADGIGPDRWIVTMSGRGYRFAGEIHSEAIAEPKPGLRPKVRWAAAFAIAAAALAAWRLVPSRPAPFSDVRITRLTDSGSILFVAIAPSGQSVAYVSGDTGRESLRLRLVSAASELELAPVADRHYLGLTFSPNGSHLYYVLEGVGGRPNSLHRVPVLGGAAVMVKQHINSPIAFSPDGASYAFVREDVANKESVAVIARSLDGAETRLAAVNFPEYLDYPAWAPNGDSILFTRVDSARVEAGLVSIALSGGAPRPVGPRDWVLIRQPAWIDRGRALLLTGRHTRDNQFGIWRVSYPEGAAQKVVHDTDDYFELSLAGDASSAVAIQQKVLSSLWVTPASGSQPGRQITAVGHVYSRVSWSPDGRIVFTRGAGSDRDIWVGDADGSNLRQLTSEGNIVGHEACLAGIVYGTASSSGTGNPEIWRMDLNGGNRRRLAPGRPPHLTCSSDGEWVAYTAGGPGVRSALWRLRTTGGTAEQLSSADAYAAAFSPDDQWIASFYEDSPSTIQRLPRGLAVLPAAGGKPRYTFPLGAGAYHRAGVRWTRDGAGIGYVQHLDGVSNIWVQPLAGGPPRQITDFRGDRILSFDWSPDGRRLCLARGTSARDAVLVRNSR